MLPRACLLSTAKSPGQAAAASRVSCEPLLGTAGAPSSPLAAAPPFPFPLPLPLRGLPIPPSLPLKEAEVPEALSHDTEGRTSVVTAAKGERRKPKKLLLLGQRGVAVAVGAVSSPFFFLLLGTARSVAEASTRRGTLLGMSATIVQERARRQEMQALPKEADVERAAAGEEKAEEVEVEGDEASNNEEADAAEGEDVFIAARRGLFRASSNASPTLSSRRDPSPSEVPFRRRPEGWRRPRRGIFDLRSWSLARRKKNGKTTLLSPLFSRKKKKKKRELSLRALFSFIHRLRASTFSIAPLLSLSLHRDPPWWRPEEEEGGESLVREEEPLRAASSLLSSLSSSSHPSPASPSYSRSPQLLASTARWALSATEPTEW